MSVETVCFGGCSYAWVYHKRQRVLLPLPGLENVSGSEDSEHVQEVLDTSTLSDRELKKICSKNNIPYGWARGQSSRKKRADQSMILRLEKGQRKNRAITSDSARKLFHELRAISVQSELIARILWFLNGSLAKTGSFVTLEGLLRIKGGDITCWNVGEKIFASIEIQISGRNCDSFIGHYLPQRILKSLLRMPNKGLFIFSNGYGGPLDPVQVNADFRKAGEKAGLTEPVTSLSLRPPYDKKRARRCLSKNLLSGVPREFLAPVSEEEGKALFTKVLTKSVQAGRKPIHNRVEVFNAILYCLSSGHSMKKKIPHLPTAGKVYSQYWRWKSKGILDEMLNLLLASRGVNSTLMKKI